MNEIIIKNANRSCSDIKIHYLIGNNEFFYRKKKDF